MNPESVSLLSPWAGPFPGVFVYMALSIGRKSFVNVATQGYTEKEGGGGVHDYRDITELDGPMDGRTDGRTDRLCLCPG